MTDCGVFLYGEADETAFDIDEELTVDVSDGTVKCCECGKKIPEGQKFATVVLHFGDEDAEEEDKDTADDPARCSETYKTCLVCDEIAEAFYCYGRIYGGQLWEGLGELYSELSTTCFDKLKTPEAKAELRRRWMEWKGL